MIAISEKFLNALNYIWIPVHASFQFVGKNADMVVGNPK